MTLVEEAIERVQSLCSWSSTINILTFEGERPPEDLTERADSIITDLDDLIDEASTARDMIKFAKGAS